MNRFLLYFLTNGVNDGSPQLWNKVLTEFFGTECGLTKAKSETCLHYKHVNGKFLLVLTEVDDLMYTGDQGLVDRFEAN